MEPNYLPDSEVFFFQLCLYPMNTLHPRRMYTHPHGGVQEGVTPSGGSGGAIPLAWGSGGKKTPDRGSRDSVPRWGWGGESPEGKIAL
jgi:hypothetical protein